MRAPPPTGPAPQQIASPPRIVDDRPIAAASVPIMHEINPIFLETAGFPAAGLRFSDTTAPFVRESALHLKPR
ncbi:unnamed protein product [Ciceribacter selenitireducens ATCC BAA-1503]|uniref:Uncharacterized protein n=1 Tax=Ciceribacter selenitireducens ATCC BAA-1503 TaxID=1336235 RepID=A0A376AAV3_9HYPH|nr:unnamed protein product [Ciceribacter selenitireducens ATCC BAA-1503]